MGPTLMLLLGLVLVLGAVGCGVLAVVGTSLGSSRVVRARLVADRTAPTATPARRSSSRTSTELGVLRYVASASSRAATARHLELAGHPGAWSVRRILVAKVVLTLVGVMVFVLMSGQGVFLGLMGLVAIGLGYVAPNVLLKGRAGERQARIQRQLPDILDQVTISVESGLSLEAALNRTGRNATGPLAEEVTRTMQDVSLGMSRRDAYQALAARTEVDELAKFVTAVVQAEEFGVPVSTIVRTQAGEMRVRRRVRAEGKAHQVSVKMIFPLMVCVMPVLFIVILAPALMNAMG
ncbi:MAG: type II secretion system F family protein [Nocardioidaceae bacterium]|nr:type II secretion system F family protein [Nocardioidaceae bacterium]